ncbi:hypothetical protein BCD49_21790 [Pseudofrankia sp. EUN1h]|nr:hypothetical protein BCD49_21790 [Pseudofrankia sp. EUN1h]
MGLGRIRRVKVPQVLARSREVIGTPGDVGRRRVGGYAPRTPARASVARSAFSADGLAAFLGVVRDAADLAG